MRGAYAFIILGVVLPLAACSSAPEAASKPATSAAKRAARSTAEKPRTAMPAVAAPVGGRGEPTAATEAYSYQSAGRRDPFRVLVSTTAGRVSMAPRAPAKRAEGVAGLSVGEMTVRGIVQMDGKLVALIQDRNGRNYIVHQGEKLADGNVKAIEPDGLVLMQDVNDPLSTARQREVRKLLRSLEEAKP